MSFMQIDRKVETKYKQTEPAICEMITCHNQGGFIQEWKVGLTFGKQWM